MRYNKLSFTILFIIVLSLVYILKYENNDAISFESYFGNTEIDYGTVESIQAERANLDSTIWKNEVLAQRYEESVIALWDSIRIREDKFSHINKFSFENIFIPSFTNEQTIDMGIKKSIYSDRKDKLNFKEWAKIVYKRAESKPGNIREMCDLADSISETLGDKKWGGGNL